MAVYTYGIHHGDFEEVSREYILKHFKNKEFIQCDLETTGFDPHTKDIMCMQLGAGDTQFVIHGSLVRQFKALLEQHILMGHNIKFDCKFLYKQNIWPARVWDTMVAEQVIHCGNPTVRHNLAAVTKRRLGRDRDKSIRDTIWKEGLTKRVIQYAADDVVDLEEIRELQLKDLKDLDLMEVIALENDFTLVLAYIEFCGFKLDRDKWLQKMQKDQEKLKQAEETLSRMVIDAGCSPFVSTQLDMFSAELKLLLSWNSPKQVGEYFEYLGMDIFLKNEQTAKKSVEAKHIKHYEAEYPIVGQYLQYKAAEKIVGTYGESFIRQINPSTGRIHTKYRQILDTGRISSGGKDRSTKEEYPNMQNLPKDKETRACFVAEEGNILVICDYMGQEQIVLANYSMDENLLKFYDEGLADMHSFVASCMYPQLQGLELEEIKTIYKEERQKAKSAGFAINYGGVGRTIAENQGISVEEGDLIYEAYFEAFPGLKAYFEKVKRQGLDKGYILIDQVIRRKSFIYGYEEYRRLKRELNDHFWDKWKLLKSRRAEAGETGTILTLSETHLYDQYKEKIKKYFNAKGKIERASLNYPIQGTSANITKLSAVYFFSWIKKKGLQGIVKLVNQVHDENIAECPLALKDTVGRELQDCMNRAALLYCKRVLLTTTPEYSPYWKK